MGLNDNWPSGGSASDWQSWVEQFRDDVIHLAQQKQSRLRPCVRTEMCTGNTYNFERMGPKDMVQKTTRHTTTPILDVDHSRRKVNMDDFQWADLSDEEDQIRSLINVNGNYTRVASMAAGRKFDDLIIAAASADATDGEGNTVALPASQTIAAGGVGMTLDKLLQAKEKMDKDEVDTEGRVFVHSAEELRALLNLTEVTSSDYAHVKALVNGEVDTFAGFKFVRSERLANATNRTCIAFQHDGIGLVIGRDAVTRITQRDDVSYAWQVYLALSANATRLQESHVVEIECLSA